MPTINRIEVYAAPISSGATNDRPVWVTTGDAGVSAREVVTYSIPPDNFTNVSGPMFFEPKRSIVEIAFEHAKGSKVTGGQQGTFDGSKLVDGKWLDWNGNIVNKPCSE